MQLMSTAKREVHREGLIVTAAAVHLHWTIYDTCLSRLRPLTSSQPVHH